MPAADLVKTGIGGLDEILSGGIPRGNVILLEGAIGCGKTTMGVEFVYRGITQFGEPGLIVLFEVAPNMIVRDAQSFGWDLRELERTDRLRIVFTSREVLRQELQQADSVLLEEAGRIGARRIFIDGVAKLIGSNGTSEARSGFHVFTEGLHRENLTAVLAIEASAYVPEQSASLPEESIADTVIRLRMEESQRATSRSLEIVKSRGHSYQMGRHTFRIVKPQTFSARNIWDAVHSEYLPGGLATYRANAHAISLSAKPYSMERLATLVGGLEKRGFTHEEAAATAGNLAAESSLDPSARNKQSGAFGLEQLLGQRLTGFTNYARNTGRDPADIETQLDWLKLERSGGSIGFGGSDERENFRRAFAPRSLKDKTDAFGQYVERPSATELAGSLDRRERAAERAAASPSSRYATGPRWDSGYAPAVVTIENNTGGNVAVSVNGLKN